MKNSNSEYQKNSQSAYHLGRLPNTDNVDEDVKYAMYTYLTLDLGLEVGTADRRARSELCRTIPKAVLAALGRAGISVEGRKVLDLGAGLGGMSEELVLNGAFVTSLEPGGAWADLTQRRVERHGGDFLLLKAFGEAIPLESESIDIIISLQVLEHVQEPNKVLAEAYRVLRPGGYFLLACENYLSFVEPHYRVPWFPMLPKSIGKSYLKALGRSPKFLEEAITYTTFPGVIGSCRRIGFIRTRDTEIANNLEKKMNTTWRVMRLIAMVTGGGGPRFLDDLSNMFKVGINELLQKPSNI